MASRASLPATVDTEQEEVVQWVRDSGCFDDLRKLVRARACVCSRMRACMRVCMYVCVLACVSACVRACVRVRVRMCVHTCVRTRMHACVCAP